jgi:hypothetical protein
LVDTTPPTTTGASSPLANGAGWNNSDVTVNLSAADNAGGSGVKQVTYSASGAQTIASTTVAGATAAPVITAEGTTTVSFYATDNAGNTETTKTVTVMIDKTPPNAPTPLVSPSPNGAGWNKSDVTVTFTGNGDAGPVQSGVASCTSPTMLTAETAMAGQVISGTCTDKAGNISVPASVTVKIDKTPPTVNVTGVSDGATYILGSVPTAGCNTSDSLSEVQNNASVSVTGGVPPGVGTFTATCSGASDQAGNNAAPVTIHYNVTYAPAGTMCLGDAGHQILQPINANGTSVFNGKSTSPAKFRVCNANGVSIGTPGVVSSFGIYQIINGTATAPNEDVASTTPDTMFRWDPSAQQWIFNINNKTYASNQTYYFQIKLNDGSVILFNYGLK